MSGHAGAVIDITSVSLPTGSLSDYVAGELAGATIISNTPIVVAGIGGMKVVYSDTYSTSLTIKEVAIYLPTGNLLYKLYLSYRAGDSLESTFLTQFNQLLASVQFKS